MKKTKIAHKSLSLSKEIVRSLSAREYARAVGGVVTPTDEGTGPEHNSCNTACAQWSCAVCGG